MAVGKYKVEKVEVDGLEDQLNWFHENGYVVEGIFWVPDKNTLLEGRWHVIGREYSVGDDKSQADEHLT